MACGGAGPAELAAGCRQMASGGVWPAELAAGRRRKTFAFLGNCSGLAMKRRTSVSMGGANLIWPSWRKKRRIRVAGAVSCASCGKLALRYVERTLANAKHCTRTIAVRIRASRTFRNKDFKQFAQASVEVVPYKDPALGLARASPRGPLSKYSKFTGRHTSSSTAWIEMRLLLLYFLFC